ncbi:MAG TPA: Tex-like N-terminal domain-containing protein, partial [Pirellulales bacterium]
MGTANPIAIDLQGVAQALHLSLRQVESVVQLLDAGNTVPFITRYRKDQTGGLDEEQIRQIEARLTRLRLLGERKQTILRSIESQGKLTAELTREIAAANSTKRLEDLYLPFKPKKQTLATVARERGLEPLAEEVLAAAPACQDLDARAADFINTDKGVATAADALLGVGHILAEGVSERADLRHKLRQILNRSGKLVVTRGEADEKMAQGFRDYFEFNESLSKVPEHRVLAINRGEKAKALRVKVEADQDAMQATMDESVCPPEHPHVDFLRGCGRDALTRLVFPSLEREVRRELTDWAEAHAVEVFAKNLRNLLLQKPIRGRRVLAIDPGFKSGCKLAALDEFGKLLDQAVIHLIGKPERRLEGRAKLVDMIKTHQLSLAAIGN